MVDFMVDVLVFDWKYSLTTTVLAIKAALAK